MNFDFLSEYEVSYFKNATDNVPKTCTLDAFFKGQKARATIDLIRKEEYKSPEYERLKLTLPAVTISASFRYPRSLATVEKVNGLVAVDIDRKDNPKSIEYLKNSMSIIDSCIYCGISAGGQGVFAIVKTDVSNATDFPYIIPLLKRCLDYNLGISVDPLGDITRLRFFSYDDDCHVNPKAETFHVSQFVERERTRIEAEKEARRKYLQSLPVNLDKKDNLEKVMEKIRIIEQRQIDITNSYQNWFNVGMAIAFEFGYQGDSLFHRVSQFHPNYDYQKTEKKYQNCLKHSTGNITIGTFFKYCKDFNI